MIAFNHDRDIDMLKLGCTLSNQTNICLQKFTDAMFHTFPEADIDLLEKVREDVVGGLSIVWTCKVVGDESFIRKYTKIC